MDARGRGRLAAEDVAGHCLSIRVRTLNRAVTAIYDESIRPLGLGANQMTLLVAIGWLGTAKPLDLCRALRMDKSTLSRDVQVMKRNGWIEVNDSARGRLRPLRLTESGASTLESALPAWRVAQEKARALLGDPAIAALAEVYDRLRRAPEPIP